MATWKEVRPLRVLDFDIENRPLSYAGDDFTFSENTAIAWHFIGEPGAPLVAALGEVTGEAMLRQFLVAYEDADMVTGHNILKHDLPLLNGASLELGLAPLSPTLVQDTYKHLKRKAGVSGSQESLAQMLGVEAPKIGMDQASWREANRLTPAGIEKTKLRCSSDVIQHMALRQRLLELDWLKAPAKWSP
jgi:hypothetical protein